MIPSGIFTKKLCPVNPEIVETHKRAMSAIVQVPCPPSGAHDLRHYQRQQRSLKYGSVIVAYVALLCGSQFFQKNPYELKHCHVNSVQVIVNDQKVPNDAFMPDFDNEHVVREYLALHTETGMYPITDYHMN